MTLHEAKTVLAAMQKHFRGDWYDALNVFGGYLGHVADITRETCLGPEGFGEHDILKDIQECWPEDRK